MASPAPTRHSRNWVWAFATVAVRVFYRIERVGPPLPPGGLLLVANHPNTLLDPAVIQSTVGRSVQFLAKSTLFRRHPLSWLIRGSGAIPIYRSEDVASTTRNTETFRAVRKALADGKAICLFPEGVSHDRGYLEPLRTGAARMTLSAGREGQSVIVVPVGLNFEHVSAFRSRVTVVVGKPIEWTDLIATADQDEPTAVRTLTERITRHLRRLVVEVDPRKDLPLVTRIDLLYASAQGVSREPRARMARRRLIADGIETLREHQPELLGALLARIEAYDAGLERFGIRDRDIDRRITAVRTWTFLIRESAVAAVCIPLACAALVVFVVPYWLTGRVSRWAPGLASRATWKVTAAIPIYGLWITAISSQVGRSYGYTTALVTALSLTTLAFLGLAAFEREASVLRTIRAFLALRLAPLRARARLKRQRDSLATILEQVAEWVRDENSAR